MTSPAGLDRAHPFTRTGVLRLVLAYATLAGLWILLSDRVLDGLVSDPELRAWFSLFKGWAFVALTSLLLYGLLHRLAVGSEQYQTERLRALMLLTAVVESSTDAIFAKDMDGRYLLFNRAAGEFVGQRPQDVLGRDDRALFPADQARLLMQAGRQVLADGQVRTVEEVLDTPGGRRVFLATKGPLRDEAGQVVGLFGISRDITERQQAEQSLRDRERKLDAIVGNSPSVLSLKDGQGRYLLANPNLQRIHHLAEGQIVGRTDFDLYPAEVAQVFQANDEQVFLSRTRRTVEEIVPVDGQPRLHLSHIFPILAQDGTVQCVCRISFDITERQRVEVALKARNAELERFNRAMVDRELDMVALKKQVEELSRQLGREA
ncbi:PAS domain S-box-containing protein [Sphaerotilus hippei]|uniref:PAS domain S-box-containing protein n=1 Tax=Sphaerotilus hippei TaxID=744406 RepID=A0A318H646_9BURK|nr:PAS domain-containing protein [Sphaerotilus hippei]PXW99430.1 PAS domain S-box-containing protein [Sphaerotilus hippei]